jgi:4-hydroxy-tetrahydrodipicolinate synthase
MQLDALNVIKALFSEVNPIPVKAALNMLGYNFGEPRLPLIPMTETNKEILQTEMEKMGILNLED